MKKFVRSLALLLAMCMLLCACGQTAKTPETTGGLNIVTDDIPQEDLIEQTLPDNGEGDLGLSVETGEEKSQEDLDATHPEESAQTPAEDEGGKKPEETKPSEEKPEETKPSEEKPEEMPEQPVAPDAPVAEPEAAYNKGVVLVKHSGEITAQQMETYGFASAERLYKGSAWYEVKLTDGEQTAQTVAQLRADGCFEEVDFDYVMATDTSTASVDVSCNPDYGKHKHHHTHKVPDGWQHVAQQEKAPGGTSDVVIAVIDTGVDYNHMDLRNNIWVNSAEIPDNGKDDDGNGYIDDVYGWDCVGNDHDPADDNGHGTHVAGIIAAENNDVGGVGIAYNCKIMVLKAGNSSGYFNNSDIAEAVQYAYMNGASVINMSFGGGFISMAVEEALENAYNTCILVAAAGNDGMCNDLSCKTCDYVGVSYPAALPYVIGVMSVDGDGQSVSSFSNYDHAPYNSVEYEVYAVGETIPSTWPGNKYATLNGTSMAAPTVSGIAALLRSYYTDRQVYSTKFIQSQIVNTGTLNPYNYLTEETDVDHAVVNIYEALTCLPKPEVKLYDYSIDDSVSISENNNGNGVMDAGETVRLYVSLHNRGGVASNVKVTADVIRGEGVVDPYFTFANDTIELSDIGTYSVRESGDKYFEILVSADCPNDYLTNINIRYTYENGLDTEDDTVYTDDGKQQARFNVSSGYHLPAVISEDTVYPADRLYIVGENVLIPAGVTVTFEAGARIQFYDDSTYFNSPQMIVYGTLNMQGTADKMITVNPSERYPNFCGVIANYGTVNLEYVQATNLMPGSGELYISNCIFYTNGTSLLNNTYIYSAGKAEGSYAGVCAFRPKSLVGSYVEVTAYAIAVGCKVAEGNYFLVTGGNYDEVNASERFANNIVVSQKGEANVGLRNSNFGGVVENNIFRSLNEDDPTALLGLSFEEGATLSNNSFSAGYRKYAAQLISGYLDASGNPTIDVTGAISDVSALYPHVVSVEIFNADGEAVTTIGKEEVTVKVTFSRPMDQSKNPVVTFGTIEPYADYKVEGQFVDELVWEGTYELKAQIENGQNFLKVKNACDANDVSKVVLGDYQLHEFTIDTTAAMAMSLFATATDSGIELSWAQDDYDTLMGYNIYRSEDKDGNFVKINPSVLTADESSFLDNNAVPGTTYWYTFTVVLSDFTESAPAGKVYCTAVDTLLPTVYHTPVNQGYLNNNLTISCTASDNMQVASVKLYYRTYGAADWKELTMSKVNDKYSAVIFGSDLSMEGLEYYLVASDGSNSVSKGTAEEPYFVVVKDASAISRKGDVDGDGTVTTKDALMIVQCKEGSLILTDDQFKRADLNESGVLDSVEALRILQYINGNVPDLNM